MAGITKKILAAALTPETPRYKVQRDLHIKVIDKVI
jgi:hypothetical protein